MTFITVAAFLHWPGRIDHALWYMSLVTSHCKYRGYHLKSHTTVMFILKYFHVQTSEQLLILSVHIYVCTFIEDMKL